MTENGQNVGASDGANDTTLDSSMQQSDANTPNLDSPMQTDSTTAVEAESTIQNSDDLWGESSSLRESAQGNTTFIGQNPAPEPMTSSNFADDKKKSKKKTLWIVILVVVVLLLGGFVIYRVYTSSPYNLFKGAINKGYGLIHDGLKELEDGAMEFNFKEDPIVMYGDVLVDTSMDEIDPYTQYTYGYRLGLDIKNEKIELGLSMSDGGKDEIIDAQAYLIDNVVYLKADKLFDKILKSEMTDEIDFSDLDDVEVEIDYKAIDEVVKAFKDYLIDSLDEEQFSKKKETIEINGKDKKVTFNTYALDEDIASEMMESVLDSLLGDDETLEKMAKISGFDKSDIEEFFESIEADSAFKGMRDVNISVLTTGITNKIAGCIVEVDGEDVIKYLKDGDYIEFFMGNEYNFITAEGTIEDLTIKYTEDDEVLFSGNLGIKEDGKKQTMEISFEVDTSEDTLEGDFTIVTNSESKKKNSASIKFDVSLEIDGESFNANGTVNLTTEVGASVADISTGGAMDVENLTETDLEKILDNLSDAIEGTVYGDLLDEYIASMEEEEEPNYCDYAICDECVDMECACTYYDEYGDMQTVFCPNPGLSLN